MNESTCEPQISHKRTHTLKTQGEIDDNNTMHDGNVEIDDDDDDSSNDNDYDDDDDADFHWN